jgi:hypothetical protein
MPGVRITVGCDLQVSNIRIEIDNDGNLVSPSMTMKLRTDMWPFWLRDAVEAAVAARRHSEKIPEVRRTGDEDILSYVMTEELRATMRAISASAFAIDGFYAAVKARTPPHPHQSQWLSNRTSRAAQISTTLAYSLKLKNEASKGLSQRLKSIFRFRDSAVHLDSKYREAIHRPDVDTGVDWHFVMFRAENAINATFATVNTLDQLVSVFDRSTTELINYKTVARKAMNEILDLYETTTLPEFPRREPRA